MSRVRFRFKYFETVVQYSHDLHVSPVLFQFSQTNIAPHRMTLLTNSKLLLTDRGDDKNRTRTGLQ